MPGRADRTAKLRQKAAAEPPAKRRGASSGGRGRGQPRRSTWKTRLGHGLWAAALALAVVGIFEAGSDAGLPPEGREEAVSSPNKSSGTGGVTVPLAEAVGLTAPEERPVWQRHAATAPEAAGRPMITVVMDDMGVNAARTQAAIELPAPLTTAFLPYGRHTARLSKLAKAGGHELLVHLPMAPAEPRNNPGPHALKAAMTGDALKAGLDWNLGRLDNYVGVNNHMGSAFTADSEAMRRVLAELSARGLLFLDSRTTKHSTALSAGRAVDIPVLERDVFLDNVRTERAIWQQLKTVERIARRKGRAIAIAHPYPETINALSVWLPRLKSRGFVLVPLSAQAERKMATRTAEQRTQ